MYQEERLKELLGHTQKEVFAGMAVGIIVALLMVRFWPAPAPCPPSARDGSAAGQAQPAPAARQP